MAERSSAAMRRYARGSVGSGIAAILLLLTRSPASADGHAPFHIVEHYDDAPRVCADYRRLIRGGVALYRRGPWRWLQTTDAERERGRAFDAYIAHADIDNDGVADLLLSPESSFSNIPSYHELWVFPGMRDEKFASFSDLWSRIPERPYLFDFFSFPRNLDPTVLTAGRFKQRETYLDVGGGRTFPGFGVPDIVDVLKIGSRFYLSVSTIPDGFQDWNGNAVHPDEEMAALLEFESPGTVKILCLARLTR
jgi:hypothetical protein